MIHSVHSETFKEVNKLFSALQIYFVSKINAFSLAHGEGRSCKSSLWECKNKQTRGTFYISKDKSLFNQLNIQVRETESFSLFSVTIHPENPHVPSFHLFVRWRRRQENRTPWQLIVDLDPSILNEASLDKNIFEKTVKNLSGDFYEEGILKGKRYSYIPEVGRKRGIAHYFSEEICEGNFEDEKAHILHFCENVIACYLSIFSAKQMLNDAYSKDKKEEQLAYHTLYFFHIVLKDRNTLSTLLTCNQHDTGIWDVLPSHINRDILSSWLEKMSSPEDLLLKEILKIFPNSVPTPVDEKCKIKLTDVIRKHYKKYLLGDEKGL